MGERPACVQNVGGCFPLFQWDLGHKNLGAPKSRCRQKVKAKANVSCHLCTDECGTEIRNVFGTNGKLSEKLNRASRGNDDNATSLHDHVSMEAASHVTPSWCPCAHARSHRKQRTAPTRTRFTSCAAPWQTRGRTPGSPLQTNKTCLLPFNKPTNRCARSGLYRFKNVRTPKHGKQNSGADWSDSSGVWILLFSQCGSVCAHSAGQYSQCGSVLNVGLYSLCGSVLSVSTHSAGQYSGSVLTVWIWSPLDEAAEEGREELDPLGQMRLHRLQLRNPGKQEHSACVTRVPSHFNYSPPPSEQPHRSKTNMNQRVNVSDPSLQFVEWDKNAVPCHVFRIL